MKTPGPIGLNEIMIVNPSTKEGARTMLFYPVGQGPDEPGYYGQMPYEQASGYDGQTPYNVMGYYGPYSQQIGMGYYGRPPKDEMGYYYGQVPATYPPGTYMGDYGESPEEISYYGQASEAYPQDTYPMEYYGESPDETSYYGQAPEAYPQYADPMGYYEESPDEMVYYGQAPEAMESTGYYGQDPSEGVEGYVREVSPPFNPRGVFVDQLGGYVRERAVDPACYLKRPAPRPMPSSFPSIFKPHF